MMGARKESIVVQEEFGQGFIGWLGGWLFPELHLEAGSHPSGVQNKLRFSVGKISGPY
jgi:hypothetical protein